jgi:uncharacterized protein (TIGR03437 family)
MLNRHVSLLVCLCLLGSIAAFGQTNQGVGYIFELPGPSSAGSNLQGFIYNGGFLNADIPTVSGPTGAGQIIPKPDGSKFYVVGANPGGLESVDPTFTTFKGINGINGTICAATITPNGQYLLVGAGPTCGASSNSATLYILNTSSDTIVANTVPQASAGILGFAVSPDSSTAWMLIGSPSYEAVSQISLNTFAQTAHLNLPYGDLSAITLSPTGLLYVTGGGAIYEITTSAPSLLDCYASSEPPLCITPISSSAPNGGIIQVSAKPGPLHFTPSGQVAYMINTDPVDYTGALLAMTVATHVVAIWPPPASGIITPAFHDIIVAGENLVYATTTTDPNYPTTLWDVATSPLSAAQDTTFSGIFPATSVISAAISNEVPSAVYLYALIANGNQTNLYRVNIATNKDVETTAALGPGLLQFVVVPPETGAAGFYDIQPAGGTQTLATGVTSATLTALVLDSTGRPVYNLPVTFAESAADAVTGVVISGATKTTNANGYVTATATVPTTSGTYTVVLTAGSATTNFALTVPGAGTGCGTSCGTGGSNQVIIISGNGEFIESNYPTFNSPMTIQVCTNVPNATGSNCTPAPNVPVTFSIALGQATGFQIGQLNTTTATTDSNGLATTNLTSPQLPLGTGVAFDSTTINASTSVGSVNFVETVFNVVADVSILPGVPVNDMLTIGEGDVLPNGIIESISTFYEGISQAVPNVAIRLANGNDPTMPSPASCQGSSLSDLNGVAHCNVTVSCLDPGTQAPIVPGTQFGVNVVVGEYVANRVVGLTVTTGTSQVLNIKSGNNQSGNAGSTLSSPLVATVTDNCGNAIPKVPVTWTVTQGSATLTNTVSTSNSGGNVQTSVALGQSPGTVLITVSIGSQQAVFTLTNKVVVAGISLVSGGGQSAYTNTPFGQPVVFTVTDVNQNPVPGIAVTLSVGTGSAAVSTPTATTNSQGQVSTTVNAGSTPGTVTIIAATGSLSAFATLTVSLKGPQVTASSFQNAATANSLNPQIGLVPCGLGTVTGLGLATTVQGVLTGNPLGLGPLAYTLGGVSMFINGVDVPLLSVSNVNGVQQVNFQTPCETVPGSAATVVIQVNTATTVVTGVLVLATQPGIINYAGPNNTPYGYVISAADGTTVTPSNPAHRGGTYYMVLTGLGETTPPITTNAVGTGSQVIPLSQVVVGVNNAGVPVTLAEYAADQIGVYVIGFTIPATAPTGTNQPLAVEVNGAFGNAVYLPAVE